jgi:hypothetical protein
MAFPGSYNFNYYRGDTFEFRVYPKDSAGGIFDLTGYGTPLFTISTSRGATGVADQISGYAVVSADKTHILCAIEPDVGIDLEAGTSYVYDIEISKTDVVYDKKYTLLTGNITVTDHVSGATGVSS